MKPQHRTVDVRGLEIHWVEWGDPVGEPILLVHGFRDNCRTWDFFVEELLGIMPDAWLVAPDCRGHGDSDWVGAGGYYHFFDYLMDLDAVVHCLGVPSIKLVGHSMGGTVSSLYAGTYPERVSGLILVEGLGPPGMDVQDAPSRVVRWLDGLYRLRDAGGPDYASIEDGARRLKKTNPLLDDARANRLARHAMRSTGRGSWTWKFDPLHRTVSPQPFYSEQFCAFLSRVSCPVLVVQGEKSHHRIRSDIAARSQSLKRASLIMIPEASHWVHVDNPAALAQAVVETWCRKTSGQGA